MNDSDSRAEQIFAVAVEIADPGTRRAHIEHVCAGDPKLLAEVESLLAAHEQADAFMRTEVANARFGVPPSSGPGAAVAGTASVLVEKIRRFALAATSSWSKSAKAASAWCGWPSRKNQCAAGGAQDHQAGHGHARGSGALRAPNARRT